MKKTALASALLTLSLGTGSMAFADQAAEIQLLKERLEKLEAKKEVSEERIEKLESKNDAFEWLDKVTFSGLIEVEASYNDPDSGSSDSDIVVATVELGIEAEITDNIAANILFLYEEDETDLEVDIATISYKLNDTGFSFLAGQDYVPFGSFETHQINDTLVLEIGETRETILAASYESGLFSGSVYAFNGEQDEGDRNTIQSFGARVGLSNDHFAVGADYISNLGDSDSLEDNEFNIEDEDAVDGVSIHASARLSNVTLLAEYLTALDEFAGDGADSEPEAFQLEAAIEVGAFTYALTYEETDEALFLELPEERISFGVSTEIFGGIGLGVQFFRDSDYSTSDGGSGDDVNSIVLQLAAEF